MTENDRETGILTQRVIAVEREIKEVKGDVSELNKKVDHLIRIAEREEGARIEREKSSEIRSNVVEMSWTKVIALSAVIGIVLQGGPLIFHAIMH